MDKRLSGHADLSVFHFGGNKLLLAPCLKGSGLERELRDRGASVSFADITQGARYPSDAQLNSCVVGRNVIFNPSVNCCKIVNYFTNLLDEYNMISCKQGYAARKIEAVGGISDRCEINREIQDSNSLIVILTKQWLEVKEKIKKIKEELSQNTFLNRLDMIVNVAGKIAAAISNGDIIKEPTFEEKLDEVLGIADKIEDALKSGDLDKKEKNYDRKGID